MRALLVQVVDDYLRHGCVTHGAALAFYALFVLVPVPIFVVAALATLVGGDLARYEVIAALRSLAGDQLAATLVQALDSASELATWRGAGLFGLASLAFGATAFFTELQDSLNRIWDVPPTGFEWRRFARSRLASFAMVAASGAILLVLTLAGAVARGFGDKLKVALKLPVALFGPFHLVAYLLVIAALCSLVFRYVPETEVSFRQVWLGSLATALLFVCGNELIGLYLRRASLATAYGAAGSLVVTLTWIYYSALAFLFGAELTRALGRRPGSGPTAGPAAAALRRTGGA